MRHALGFDRRSIEFLGFRISLHKWDKEASDDRHNHLRSFIGIPLRGRFVERRYVCVPGRGWNMFHSQPSAHGSCVTEESKSTADLMQMYRRIRGPFHPYICKHDAIHHVGPWGAGPHYSLCFFGRVKKESTIVFRKVAR